MSLKPMNADSMRTLHSSFESAERQLKINTVVKHVYQMAIIQAERHGKSRYVFAIPFTASASTTFGKVELPSSQGFISYPIYIYNKDIIENMDAILEELRNLFQGQSVEYKIATMMTSRNGREEDISTLDREIDSYTDPNDLRKEQQIIIDWS